MITMVWISRSRHDLSNRGMSAIVATILIVLLTVVAVAFIAAFVVPFARDKLYESTECLDYEKYFTLEDQFDYMCYGPSGDGWLYGISVRADSVGEDSDKPKGFTLQMIGGGESESVDVFEGSSTNPSDKGIRMLNRSKSVIEIPYEGGVKTYVYNSSMKFNTIEIYPVLESGKLCDVSDSFEIRNRVCTEELEVS